MAEGAAAVSRRRSHNVDRTERVVASAPGKLILMGEHAAVYGRPALVAALDRRTTVTIQRGAGGVELDLTTLEYRESTSWPDLLDYCETKRSEWRRFSENPEAASVAALVGEQPAHVVRVALGETMRDLDIDPPAIRVEVSSEIPVGSGFGSSASVAVAIIGALLELVGEPIDKARVSRIALDVERRQHGRPSGVDHTAVLNGGLLRLERVQGRLEALALEVSSRRLEDLLVFHTGSPPESTGTVVAAVRVQRERDRDGFDDRLDRMERATRDFETGLADPASGDILLRSTRAFEGCLEELGVVPDAIAARIRRLEAAGGAGKISGAGTLSQNGAGALLVWPSPGSTSRRDGADLKDLLSRYQSFGGGDRTMIGAPGLSIEDRR